MSMQAIFDKIVNHLVTQGEPSGRYSQYESDYVCLYRSYGSKGQPTMCAVGRLISDEVYAKHFDHDDEDKNKLERISATNEMVKRAVVDSNPGILFTPQDFALLADCQTAHDQAARESGRPDKTTDKDLFMHNLAKRMSLVAGLYRLVVPEELYKAAGQTPGQGHRADVQPDHAHV